MIDLVVTGGSRGLGRALVEAVHAARPGAHRFVLSARAGEALEATATALRARGAEVLVVPGDLSSVSSAAALGEALRAAVRPGAVAVANAGLWPGARRLGPDGLEEAFVVNAVSLRPTWEPLLRAGAVARLLGVGAGLMTIGRFDPARTPTGEDYGPVATYATTKLAGAYVLRDLCAEHPGVDGLVCHPGVVDTGLGVRTGVFGAVLRLVKRLGFEAPDRAGARLARILAVSRWSDTPGAAPWWDEETPRPWPAVADDPATRAAVRGAISAALAGPRRSPSGR